MLNRGLTYSLLFLLASSHGAMAQSNRKSADVIKPSDRTADVKSASIDTEKFELGLYVGALAVEDFSTNMVSGVSFSYHISNKLLAQFNYGEADVDETTSESVTDTQFLADDDRAFRYYNLLAGYKLFPGRSFLGSKRKFNSDIYLLAGINNVEFAGESNTGVTIGASYRVVLKDWLTFNLDFRDHIVQRDFLNNAKTTQNTETTLGLNLLF